MTATRNLTVVAAVSGALAVIIGAFAAHGAGPQVKPLLTTGGHYLLVHALLAVVCAVWPGRDRRIVIAGWLALAGGLVFCLALSLVALLGLSVMGAVAPIGGVLMISAWLLLALAALRSQSTSA